jgi:hypothetical protein
MYATLEIYIYIEREREWLVRNENVTEVFVGAKQELLTNRQWWNGCRVGKRWLLIRDRFGNLKMKYGVRFLEVQKRHLISKSAPRAAGSNKSHN